jgi:hypothetical protein
MMQEIDIKRIKRIEAIENRGMIVGKIIRKVSSFVIRHTVFSILFTTIAIGAIVYGVIRGVSNKY